jgi:hypothetical protein
VLGVGFPSVGGTSATLVIEAGVPFCFAVAATSAWVGALSAVLLDWFFVIEKLLVVRSRFGGAIVVCLGNSTVVRDLVRSYSQSVTFSASIHYYRAAMTQDRKPGYILRGCVTAAMNIKK